MMTEITANNNEEFEKMIENKDIRIAYALVKTILKNINGRKRHIPALSVYIEEEEVMYDITVDREQFIHTLTSNLPILEANEMYEECAEIMKAVKVLEEKNKK